MTVKAISLCGFLTLAMFGAPNAAPLPAGPGGVYDAAVRFGEALANGDAEHLGTALVRSRQGIEFTTGTDGQLHHEEPETPFDFYDVGADGRPWIAHEIEPLLGGLSRLADPKLGRPATRVTRAYADCPGERCSFVVVEFERVWGTGESARTVPMRATALLRWVGGEGTAFKLFHWHATPR
ncbi:MAG: hypothetical protein KDB80_10360 [Planctomycetes bacterium]|nr:hypothetical protein [Planctomycetota bacterium]